MACTRDKLRWARTWAHNAINRSPSTSSMLTRLPVIPGTSSLTITDVIHAAEQSRISALAGLLLNVTAHEPAMRSFPYPYPCMFGCSVRVRFGFGVPEVRGSVRFGPSIRGPSNEPPPELPQSWFTRQRSAYSRMRPFESSALRMSVRSALRLRPIPASLAWAFQSSSDKPPAPAACRIV